MRETGIGEPRLDGLLHVGAAVGLGQDRRCRGEGGIRLDGELVAGKMRRGEDEGVLDVGECLVDRLSGQTIHQVEIEIVEMPGGDLDGAPRFVAVVDSSESLEVGSVEALNAQGQTIHAGGTEGRELAGFDSSGIGFQGDFGVRQ